MIGAYASGLAPHVDKRARDTCLRSIFAECAIPECGPSPGATFSVNGEFVRMKVGPTMRCS